MPYLTSYIRLISGKEWHAYPLHKKMISCFLFSGRKTPGTDFQGLLLNPPKMEDCQALPEMQPHDFVQRIF
jgi:hypothetical protein